MYYGGGRLDVSDYFVTNNQSQPIGKHTLFVSKHIHQHTHKRAHTHARSHTHTHTVTITNTHTHTELQTHTHTHTHRDSDAYLLLAWRLPLVPPALLLLLGDPDPVPDAAAPELLRWDVERRLSRTISAGSCAMRAGEGALAPTTSWNCWWLYTTLPDVLRRLRDGLSLCKYTHTWTLVRMCTHTCKYTKQWTLVIMQTYKLLTNSASTQAVDAGYNAHTHSSTQNSGHWLHCTLTDTSYWPTLQGHRAVDTCSHALKHKWKTLTSAFTPFSQIKI
jgi:hypothetical protein